MIIPTQPNFNVVNTAEYRETYANSVQVRVNVWDFFLVFGTMQQQSENQVEVRNFQGIYLSPQQAKALAAILQQNVSDRKSTRLNSSHANTSYAVFCLKKKRKDKKPAANSLRRSSRTHVAEL